MVYRTKTCSRCGLTFTPVSGATKWCDSCRNRSCARCNTTFTFGSGNVGKGNYCSNKCYLEARWMGHDKLLNRQCKFCGIDFTVAFSHIRKSFCCRSHLRKYVLSKPDIREPFIQAIRDSRRSESARKQLDEARTKRKFGPEMRAKVRAARLKQRLPTRMTSIEQALHDEFKKRRLTFEMHKTMFGRWQPDFVFESAKLIVQADGAYWHGTAKAQQNDAAFNTAAIAEGWTVWRFVEAVIKFNTDGCAQAVDKYIRRAKQKTNQNNPACFGSTGLARTGFTETI